MFVDSTLTPAVRAVPTAPAADRRFIVEPTHSCWHARGFYARLRKYGHGGGCIAQHVPNYFGSVEAALEAGRRWVESGN